MGSDSLNWIRELPGNLLTFSRLDIIWLNLRQGTRSICRNPVMLVVAVLSLGLGIGATSTIYGLVDTLLLHDVTARQPERLVSFWTPWNSYLNYQDLSESGVFEELAAGNPCYPPLRWRNGDGTREIAANCVSGNFFEVVGVKAATGRVFLAEEAAAEKDPRVVVISHQFWRGPLAGDPDAIGREITLNNTAFTIIGVLPANYRSIEGGGLHPDVFVPLNTALKPNLFDRKAAIMTLIGRLMPGRTREETQQALTTALQGLEERFPDQQKRQRTPPPTLTPVEGLAKYREGSENQMVLAFSLVLSVVAVLVLLIACTNVAGLLLARGAARRNEIATRVAIGASRSQLIKQLLLEAALVAAAGTAAGIGFTLWAAGLLSNVRIPGDPIRFDFSPDWRFACAAAVLSVIATLVSGLVPALVSSRTDLSKSLRASRGTAPRLGLRSLLVVAQIGFSVILLSGAFIFVRNLTHVVRFDPGFDAAHTLWIDLSIDEETSNENAAARRDRVYRVLEAQPGVESVSWAWYLPFNLAYGEPELRRATDSAAFQTTEQGIGPNYLKTMGIPLVAGREFDWNDLKPRDRGTPQPVIINEVLARKYFQGQNPIGEPLVGGRNGVNKTMVIIGISANTSFRSPGEEPIPLLQSLAAVTSSFIVRTAGPPSAAAPGLSKTIERNNPGAGVGYFTVRERLNRGLWPARAATALLGLLAGMGLLLALIGLCGISIYNVTRRATEIGIRMALGATAGNIMWLILRDCLKLVTAGSVLGVICTLPLTRLLRQFLAAGISPLDPLAFVAVLTTLLATAACSVWFPCWRATRVDPSISLRID